jgi:hypothetical protein
LLFFRGAWGEGDREAERWLASGDAATLLRSG